MHIWGALFVATFFLVLGGFTQANAGEVTPVKARPLIAGDVMPDFHVEGLDGFTRTLAQVLDGKFGMVAFVPPEALNEKNTAEYFRSIRGHIIALGYEIVVITPPLKPEARTALSNRGNLSLYVDSKREAFKAMGLADSTEADSPVINGIYFIDPSRKILSQFASVDREIPFSGDALVLSARVYKQLAEKSAIGFRSGLTVAPPGDSPYIEMPDESVLRLLTIDDIGRSHTVYVHTDVGLTFYDARRNAWSPRWSPGIQIGRRLERWGAFLNFALDQTFDLTQEIKRLDVLHFGVGLETLALYGRMRSSISTGIAVLNSDTDIDSRGKIGWYFDLRPISVRWGSGTHGAYELTPFSLNVSAPVTRGIPLVQVGYMTTLSYEFAWSLR